MPKQFWKLTIRAVIRSCMRIKFSGLKCEAHPRMLECNLWHLLRPHAPVYSFQVLPYSITIFDIGSWFTENINGIEVIIYCVKRWNVGGKSLQHHRLNTSPPEIRLKYAAVILQKHPILTHKCQSIFAYVPSPLKRVNRHFFPLLPHVWTLQGIISSIFFAKTVEYPERRECKRENSLLSRVRRQKKGISLIILTELLMLRRGRLNGVENSIL